MDENRLTKKIFNYDYSIPGGKSWCSNVKTILPKVDLLTIFYDKTPVNSKNIENQLLDNHRVKWSNKIQTVSKLRTYREFKYKFKEKNLLSNITKLEKLHFAQFRCVSYPSE